MWLLQHSYGLHPSAPRAHLALLLGGSQIVEHIPSLQMFKSIHLNNPSASRNNLKLASVLVPLPM